MFLPYEFLYAKVPDQLKKVIDRKQLAVVKSSRESFLTATSQNLPKYVIPY